MKRICLGLVAAVALAVGAVGFMTAKDKPADAPADTTPARKADEAAVRDAMQGFTRAFEKGDAAAAAAFLTSGAELVPDDGATLRGRDAIQKAFADHFAKNPRVKMTLEVDSVRFTSRDSAIEEGQMTVVPVKGEPSHNRYSVMLVREDGKWLLAFIKEWPHEQAELRDLEWLIGSWTVTRKDADVKTTYEWFGNKAFIKAQFTVHHKDKTYTGMKLIGTDPTTGKLRTWTFEADGGFGEGTVAREGKKWLFETATALTDGTVLEATNILIQVDKDTFTWQPVDLVVDGEPVGNQAPVKVTRVKNVK